MSNANNYDAVGKFMCAKREAQAHAAKRDACLWHVRQQIVTSLEFDGQANRLRAFDFEALNKWVRLAQSAHDELCQSVNAANAVAEQANEDPLRIK